MTSQDLTVNRTVSSHVACPVAEVKLKKKSGFVVPGKDVIMLWHGFGSMVPLSRWKCYCIITVPYTLHAAREDP